MTVPRSSSPGDTAAIREALTGSVLGGYLSRQEAALAALARLETELAEWKEIAPAELRTPGLMRMYFDGLEDQVDALVARAEAAEAERDELAVSITFWQAERDRLREALSEIAQPMPETDGDWGSTYDWEKSSNARRDIARAALAEGQTP